MMTPAARMAGPERPWNFCSNEGDIAEWGESYAPKEGKFDDVYFKRQPHCAGDGCVEEEGVLK